MIAVLDYNKSKPVPLLEMFSELNLEFNLTLLESKLIQSDRIILPPIDNFDKTYRKLQIMNIFNLLKIYRKPILSIEDGFLLMKKKTSEKEKQGLGFFDITTGCNYINDSVNKECSLCKLKESKLLKNIIDGEKIIITGGQKEIISEYCTSLTEVDGEKYAVTSENKKYFAVHINYEENIKFVKRIINNFTYC